MLNVHFGGALLLTVAEIVGAILFFTTHHKTARKAMTAFGLGFAVAIVLIDMLPDATENYKIGYALFAVGIALMGAIWRFAKGASTSSINGVAVAGMALHNFGEGVVLTSMTGPVSVLFALGAVLHKLPEGMATYSLLGDLKEKLRFSLSILAALMIPFGMLVHLPESVQQPVMSLLSGMILVSVSTTIATQKESKEILVPRWQVVSPYAAGAVIGAVSCLLA